jgi:hypothetical protein
MKYLNKKKNTLMKILTCLWVLNKQKIAKNKKKTDFLPLFANSKRPVSAVF